MGKENKGLSKRHYYAIALVLLAFMFFNSLSAVTYYSTTFDETMHIGAAYYYWKTGNITLNREQPPLVKIIAGIPLAFLDLNYPEGDWSNKEQIEFGKLFLYHMGNDLDLILLFSRVAVVALSLLLGSALFLFVSKIYGYESGIFALFLYVFEANIIAHSSVVTTDIAVTLFIFLTIFALWHFVRLPTYWNALPVALFFAIAQVSKFTALYLVPIFLVMIIFFIFRKFLRFSDVLKLFAIIVIVSIFTINLFYLFQGTGKAFTENISADRIEKHIIDNPLSPLVLFAARMPIPLPENYMLGLSDAVLHDISGHSAFFLGEYSYYGWWYYFPVLFLLKVSIFLLIFIAISVYTFYRVGLEKKDDQKLAEYMAIIFVFLFFAISAFSDINIGIRHVLPVFPFILFLCSKSIKYIKNKTPIYILASLFALSSLFAAPHYISFFNEAIGNDGYLYALDSNYDWGQDLRGLSNYMKANGIESIKLKYFGTAEPDYYGIEYEQLECSAATGTIAISAQHLQEVSSGDRGCYGWLKSSVPIARIGSIFVYRL